MKKILGLSLLMVLMIPIAGFSGNGNSSYQYQYQCLYQCQASYPTGQVVILGSEDSGQDLEVTNIGEIKIQIDTTQIISTLDGQELAFLDLQSEPFFLSADRVEVSIDTIRNSDIQIIKVKVDRSSDIGSQSSQPYVPPVGFSDSIH